MPLVEGPGVAASVQIEADQPKPGYAKGTYTPSEWAPKADPVSTHPIAGFQATEDAWVRHKNAGLDITQVPRRNSTVAWFWKCPDGHEWQEKMTSIFGKTPRWKRFLGRRGAMCRVCALEKYGLKFPCGHIAGGLSELTNPPKIISGTCPECDPKEWAELNAAKLAKRRAIRNRSAKKTLENGDWGLQPGNGKSLYSNAFIAWTRAEDLEQRCWELSPRILTPDLGKIHPLSEKNTSWDSGYESKVRTHLVNKGFPVTQESLTVPDLVQNDGTTWRITPDIICENVAIEVDAPSVRGGGPSHTNSWPAEDLYRDDCLRAIGYWVIRVRIGDLPSVPDTWNVRSQSLNMTMLNELELALGKFGILP